MKPLIGITTSTQNNEFGWRYHAGYANNAAAVMKAGGLPVFIPNGLPSDTRHDLYNRLDGVLIAGGHDIDPERYGDERHPLSQESDPERDDLEIAIAGWAVNDDKPLLGICRGHQVLNVALGGKLVQDVTTLTDTNMTHDHPFTRARSEISHHVYIEADSLLANIVRKTEIAVNSLHHQAVIVPGINTRVTARAADGTIEAVEIPDRLFVLSVQWHPEDLVGKSEEADHLFAAFVTAAHTRLQTKQYI